MGDRLAWVDRQTFVWNQTLDYLRSDGFWKKLQGKNLPQGFVIESLRLLELSEGELRTYADSLVGQACDAMTEFVGEAQTVAVAYSGGRDSSVLVTLLGRMEYMKGRNLVALKALTGTTENSTGVDPVGYFNNLVERSPYLDGNSSLWTVDLSGPNQRFMFTDARQHRDYLGHPAICTDCKGLMEPALTLAALRLGAERIMYGYADYQNLQSWPEQSEVFRRIVRRELNDRFPEIAVGDPLYEVLSNPLDVFLIAGHLGLDVVTQKGETSCVAGGMNPASIDEGVLSVYLEQMVPVMIDEVVGQDLVLSRGHGEPVIDLTAEARKLKGDYEFMRGAYHEQ